MKQIKLEKQVADLQKRVESLERHQGYLRQSYAELIREHNKRVCEDYTPQEPLIKDEKIRKAVSFVFMVGESIFVEKNDSYIRFVNKNSDLVFYGRYNEPELAHKTYYTITELCQEDE